MVTGLFLVFVVLFVFFVFGGFVKDAYFGLKECDLLAGMLHFLFELLFEEVGLFAVGEETEVVFPKFEVGVHLFDLGEKTVFFAVERAVAE